MEWIKAVYRFAGFFSYRVPGFSSQYALSSPIPGPSTIKLGLISTGIEQKADPTYGELLFSVLKYARIRIVPPERLSICNFLLKRLKKSREDDKPLQTTFGTRGYVHYGGPLTIYIEVETGAEQVREVAGRLPYLGTSDSILACSESFFEEPPDSALGFTLNLNAPKPGDWLIMAKDINNDSDVRFTHLNPFSEEKHKMPLIPCYASIPLQAKREGGNWTVYDLGG